LLKRQFLRLGATIAAITAVLALSILPGAHLHQSISGTPLIHSHFHDDPIEHAGTLDHGDHRGVRTLASVFSAERTEDSVPAYTIIGMLSVAMPEAAPVRLSDALDASVIHGPPRSVLSLRAPPA
jgi:hypothetical protein